MVDLSQFSAEERRRAIAQINLELQGKRTNIAQENPRVIQAFKLIRDDPSLRGRFESVTQQVQLARESGFSSVQEFQQARGFFASGISPEERIRIRQEGEVSRVQEQFPEATPIFTRGRLTGFDTPELQQSIGIEQFRRGFEFQRPLTTQLGFTPTPEEESKKLSFRDVSLAGTFFPATQREIESGVRKPLGEDQVTLQTFFEAKAQKGLARITEEVKPFFPEGKTKEVLFETPVDFRVSDLAKFGLFAPFLATTPEVLARVIRFEGIKPVTRVKFEAVVKSTDKGADVGVISISETGGLKVGGVSKQFLQQGDDISFGIGRTITSRTIKESRIGGVGFKGSSREITRLRVAGVSKPLGQARLVRRVEGVDVGIEVGTGVESKIISQEIEGIVARSGFGFFRKTFRTRAGVKTITKPIPKKELDELIGVIKPITSKEGVTSFRFVGEAGKPVTRVTKQSVTKVIRDPDITGTIRVGESISDDVSSTGVKFLQTGLVKKTPLSKTFQQEITTQVGGFVKASEKALAKEISKTSVRTKIIPTTRQEAVSKVKDPISITQEVKQTSRFTDQTSGVFKEIDIQRFGSLGVIKSRFDLGLGEAVGVSTKTGQRGKQRLVSETKARQKQKEVIVSRERSLLREIQKTRQLPRLKFRQKQIQKQKQIGFFPTLLIPRTPEEFPPQARKPKKKKKRKPLTKVTKGTSDVFLSEGFLERNLKFAPIKIKQKDLLKEVKLREFDPFRVRRRVVVVKKKRKKRKR